MNIKLIYIYQLDAIAESRQLILLEARQLAAAIAE